ncbi:MAG: hypothetical protein OHK0039_15840 [Bacteroidia bacterium]
MRCLIIFVGILLPSLPLLAQNNLFLPFGQSSDEVKYYLATRDYIVNIEEDDEMRSLRALMNENKQVEYVFHDGKLYATTISMNYTDKRLAREAEANCMAYMNEVRRGIGEVKRTEQDGVICYTALTDTRILKLFIQAHANSTTLTLTSVSRRHSPESVREDYYYEVDLLQRRFISNERRR